LLKQSIQFNNNISSYLILRFLKSVNIAYYVNKNLYNLKYTPLKYLDLWHYFKNINILIILINFDINNKIVLVIMIPNW